MIKNKQHTLIVTVNLLIALLIGYFFITQYLQINNENKNFNIGQKKLLLDIKQIRAWQKSALEKDNVFNYKVDKQVENFLAHINNYHLKHQRVDASNLGQTYLVKGVHAQVLLMLATNPVVSLTHNINMSTDITTAKVLVYGSQ